MAPGKNLTATSLGKEHLLGILKIAVEQSVDGIVAVDLEGKVQLVNSAWARMHGYTAQELRGQHLDICHSQEQWLREVAPFLEKVKELVAHQGEVGHLNQDGTVWPAWMTVSLLKDEHGNPTGYVATAKDLTETKAAT